MKTRSQSFFRISSLVCARDLITTLAAPIDAHRDGYEAWHQMAEDEGIHLSFTGSERLSLVMDGDKILGSWSYLAGDDLDDLKGREIRDFSHPISVTDCVSSDCSFFEIADCFARQTRPLYFVIDGAEITGTVSYSSLFSRLGQLCIMSLVFGLEAVAEELCLLRPKESWGSLSVNRRERALQTFQARYAARCEGIPDNATLLYRLKSTNFIDKKTMLTKILPDSIDRKNLKRLFVKSEKVRNMCAHGSDPDEIAAVLPQQDFALFLHGVQNLIETLRIQVSQIEWEH